MSSQSSSCSSSTAGPGRNGAMEWWSRGVIECSQQSVGRGSGSSAGLSRRDYISLIPDWLEVNAAEPWALAARSRLGGRTGPTHGILVPKSTALRGVRGRSGASPYL